MGSSKKEVHISKHHCMLYIEDMKYKNTSSFGVISETIGKFSLYSSSSNK